MPLSTPPVGAVSRHQFLETISGYEHLFSQPRQFANGRDVLTKPTNTGATMPITIRGSLGQITVGDALLDKHGLNKLDGARHHRIEERRVLKGYTVFHVSQIDGIDFPQSRHTPGTCHLAPPQRLRHVLASQNSVFSLPSKAL